MASPLAGCACGKLEQGKEGVALALCFVLWNSQNFSADLNSVAPQALEWKPYWRESHTMLYLCRRRWSRRVLPSSNLWQCMFADRFFRQARLALDRWEVPVGCDSTSRICFDFSCVDASLLIANLLAGACLCATGRSLHEGATGQMRRGMCVNFRLVISVVLAAFAQTRCSRPRAGYSWQATRHAEFEAIDSLLGASNNSQDEAGFDRSAHSPHYCTRAEGHL